MADHNFGPCKQCDCEFTRLFDVTNLATGAKDQRICCRRHPAKHWRPATVDDIIAAIITEKGPLEAE